MAFDQSKFMATAIELASAALEKGELPIAAVIVLDNSIVAQAHASEISEKRFLVHAELLALLDLDKLGLTFDQRRSAKLLTTLEPCMMCLGACQSCFVGEVYYALESHLDGAVEIARQLQREREGNPGPPWPSIEGGMLREESKALFQNYVSRHSSGAMWRWAQALVG